MVYGWASAPQTLSVASKGFVHPRRKTRPRRFLWRSGAAAQLGNTIHTPCEREPAGLPAKEPLVLLAEREYWALHSDKRRKARRMARQG